MSQLALLGIFIEGEAAAEDSAPLGEGEAMDTGDQDQDQAPAGEEPVTKTEDDAPSGMYYSHLVVAIVDMFLRLS